MRSLRRRFNVSNMFISSQNFQKQNYERINLFLKKKKLNIKKLKKINKRKNEHAGLASLKKELETWKKAKNVIKYYNTSKNKIHSPEKENTATLFIGNVPEHVSDLDFEYQFKPFGALKSVRVCPSKVGSGRSAAFGFVNYVHRSDAKRAMEHCIKNRVWNVKLRCNWSTPPSVMSRICERRPLRFIDSILPTSFSNFMFSYRNSTYSSIDISTLTESRTPPEFLYPPVIVKVPGDNDVKNVIDSAAHYVSKYGSEFEFHIIQRERINPSGLFKFLFEVESPNHFYYRWRLWSFLMGDPLHKWREVNYQTTENGPIWKPPLCDYRPPKYHFSGQSSSPEKKKLTKDSFPDDTRIEFMIMLRKLTIMKKSIRNGMCFCVEHIAHAVEICEIICEALSTPQINYEKKLARIYLLSDILHNSVIIRSAGIFRKEFKRLLYDTMKSLQKMCLKLNSREQKLFEMKVSKVLSFWEDRLYYTAPYINGLRTALINHKNFEFSKKLIIKSKSKNTKENEKKS